MINAIIVDDEPYCCEALSILLGRYCPQVDVRSSYHSAIDALGAIREQKPQLLFLDIEMPRMNGFEVLRWLKDRADYAYMPKIILSGSSVEEDVAKAYDLGANTFFTKPHGVVKFRELMQYVVGYWILSQQPALHHAA